MQAAVQLVLAGVFCLTSLAAGAQIQPNTPALTAAGGYLLSTDAGARRCVVLLRAIAVQNGHALGFPIQCRVALPILGEVAAWTVESGATPEKARIRFHDARGEVLISFDRPGENEGLAGKDREGKDFLLQPGDGRSLAVRFGGAAVARQRRQPQPVGPATNPASPGDVRLMTETAGDYDFLRGPDTPTGCRLTLTAAGTAKARATLAQGCPDQGIVYFAPESWSIADGTLWLLNGRGQKISFGRARRGGWEKGAGQGAPLLIQRH